MQIAPDAHVTIRYCVAFDNGDTPDCTVDGQETVYIHGRGQVLPGLETRLIGHAVGDRLDLSLTPAEAFGEHDPALETRLPLSEFDAESRARLQPGTRFQGPHPKDAKQVVTYFVRELTTDTVVASANHPYAGRSLKLSVQVLSVRESTADELAGNCCGKGSCGASSCGSEGCDCAHEQDHDHDEHEHGHHGGCGSGGCGGH